MLEPAEDFSQSAFVLRLHFKIVIGFAGSLQQRSCAGLLKLHPESLGHILPVGLPRPFQHLRPLDREIFPRRSEALTARSLEARSPMAASSQFTVPLSRAIALIVSPPTKDCRRRGERSKRSLDRTIEIDGLLYGHRRDPRNPE